MRRLLLVLAVGSSSCFNGCSFGFDRPSLVIDRRILAVQAEPPELTLPPTFGFGLSVHALVVEPFSSDPSVPFVWRACAIDGLPPGSGNAAAGGFGGTNARLCPDDEGRVELKSGEAPLSELQVPFAVGREVLGVLQAAGGYKQLQVELQVGRDDELILNAEKKVAVGFAALDAGAPNKNPVLTGLTLDGADWVEGTPAVVSYGGCPDDKKETVRLPSDGGVTGGGGFFGGRRDGGANSVVLCTHDLVPLFDPDQDQEYLARGQSGDITTQKERLRFSWFAEVGNYRRETTQEVDPNVGSTRADDGPPTVWREPEAKPDLVTFWLVVRDGRGGESWYRRQIQFQ